jgi:hypothetical protein
VRTVSQWGAGTTAMVAAMERPMLPPEAPLRPAGAFIAPANETAPPRPA